MADNQPNELSERGLEILRLIATGATNKDIAQQLFISPNTVKVHLKNIFSKIGAASRTEAALYAVRMGLVPGATGVIEEPEALNEEPIAAPEAGVFQGGVLPSEMEASPVPVAAPRKVQTWLVVVAVVVLVTVLGVGGAILRGPGPITTAAAGSTPTEFSRWLARAPLPTPRRGLAAAAYEDQIYVLGGETDQGVTGASDIYNPSANTWQSLASMPMPVTDIQAVVIGGLIYVPGGRTQSGSISKQLEVYDTRQSRWEQRSSLPVALSGYALIAYEGRLYLFGGWDGAKVHNEVYIYEPSTDTWSAATPMPTARAFAGAAEAGGKIYVIGGYDGQHALAVNEVYFPDREGGSEKPWASAAPIPDARYAMGVASVADIIHVMGGKDGAAEGSSSLSPLEYFPQRDEWEAFESPLSRNWSQFGLVSLGTQLYLLGGWTNDRVTAETYSYQAIFTVIIPGP